MTFGSTSLGEISQPKVPSTQPRVAHTVVTNYCGPFQSLPGFNNIGDFDVLRIIKMSDALWGLA
jgi:hypothetical protein